MRGKAIVASGRANTLKLIGRDRSPRPAPTNQHRPLDAPVEYSPRDKLRIIRISVPNHLFVRPEVRNVVPHLPQFVHYVRLQRKSAMIARHRQFHLPIIPTLQEQAAKW